MNIKKIIIVAISSLAFILPSCESRESQVAAEVSEERRASTEASKAKTSAFQAQEMLFVQETQESETRESVSYIQGAGAIIVTVLTIAAAAMSE